MGIKIIDLHANELPTHKIPLLYIAGTGRNGSTLLERILNEIPGVFAAGELGRLTRYNPNKMCLCGQHLINCPIWQEIINEVDEQVDETKFTQLDKRYAEPSVIDFFKLFSKRHQQDLPDDFKQYLNGLAIKYRTIHKHKKCQVITDSTIDTCYGYYLSLIPTIDLYVVHLIRDPRGVAYSWQRMKFADAAAKKPWTPKIPPLQSAWSWIKRNIFIELMFAKSKKYLRVHYEDLVDNPADTIKKIAQLLNLQAEHLDFIEGNKIQVGENHLIGGNLGVFREGRGEIVLKSDKKWQVNLKWLDIILVTLMTWPLRLKYFLTRKYLKQNFQN